MEKRKCIVIAYYLDGKFAGWYGDSFGTIAKYPKIYGESSLERVKKTFTSKVRKIRTTSLDEEKDNLEGRLSALSLAIFSSEDEIRAAKTVELIVFDSPEYDGPNPDFDKAEKIKWDEERKQIMSDAGIFDIPAPSMERMAAIKEFEENHPKWARFHTDWWVYCDYDKVKLWVDTSSFGDAADGELLIKL